MNHPLGSHTGLINKVLIISLPVLRYIIRLLKKFCLIHLLFGNRLLANTSDCVLSSKTTEEDQAAKRSFTQFSKKYQKSSSLRAPIGSLTLDPHKRSDWSALNDRTFPHIFHRFSLFPHTFWKSLHPEWGHWDPPAVG